MPPPRHLLASRIRGYVCRSCLSKLQAPQRQRIPWVSRSISTSVARLRGEGKDTDQEPTVRFWDQAPDGTRREIKVENEEDEDEREFAQHLEESMRDLEQETGKSIAELVDEDDENVEAMMGKKMHQILERGKKQLPFDMPSAEELDMLREQTEQMQAQLDIIQQFGGADMKTISEEDRLKLREALLGPIRESMDRSRSAATNPQSSSDFFSSASIQEKPALVESSISPRSDKEAFLIPVDQFPEEHRPRLRQLNRVLFPDNPDSVPRAQRRPRRPLYQKPKFNKVQEVWKAYILCRNTLIAHPVLVPRRTWGALWNVLTEESPKNLDRMAHTRYLGNDMRKAGVHLNTSRHRLYIEALFIDGDRDSAFKEWEDSRDILTTTNPQTYKYWELGIRMFSLDCQPDRALQAAEAVFDIVSHPDKYRLLIPIIRSYLAIEREDSVQRAWGLYIRMRIKLNTRLTMEDYDSVTSIFMAANQPYLALGAFKDMMLTGDIALADEDSTAVYRKATGVNEELDLEMSATELDWKNSKTLASLPPRFNNKFFFGKWIKKLIGEGELDMAKKVFDLMEDRHMMASPIHLNGLIGAWFREGSERSRKLAEDTAWKMIKARTDFVQDRDQWQGLQSPLRTLRTNDLPDSKAIFSTPPATIETFTILIEHYRRRQRHDLMSNLFDALKLAKVTPNTAFLNELLLMDTKVRNYKWAWGTFQTLTAAKQVRPDFETYIILWNLVKKAVDPVIGIKGDDISRTFPTCRQLFADMMKHLPAVSTKLTIPKELYDHIILSFSLAQDQPGIAVALTALQRYFNGLPSPETVRTIVLGLARFGLEKEDGSLPRRLDMNAAVTQERVVNVTRILEKLKNRRIEALRERGIIFDHLNDIAKVEETLILLIDLLRLAAQARLVGEQSETFDASKAAREAAETMGVPDCVPWEGNGRV